MPAFAGGPVAPALPAPLKTYAEALAGDFVSDKPDGSKCDLCGSYLSRAGVVASEKREERHFRSECPRVDSASVPKTAK